MGKPVKHYLRGKGKFLEITGKRTYEIGGFGLLIPIGIVEAKSIFREVPESDTVYEIALFNVTTGDQIMPYDKLADISMDGEVPETVQDFLDYMASLTEA